MRCPTCGSFSKQQKFCQTRHQEAPYNGPHIMQLANCVECADPCHFPVSEATPPATQTLCSADIGKVTPVTFSCRHGSFPNPCEICQGTYYNPSAQPPAVGSQPELCQLCHIPLNSGEGCHMAVRAPESAEQARAWLIECRPKDGSDTWKWLGLPYKSELQARKSAYGNPDYEYRIVPLYAAERVAALKAQLKEAMKVWDEHLRVIDSLRADLAEALRTIERLEKRLRKYECPTCGSDQRFHPGWVGIPLHCSDEFHNDLAHSAPGARAEKDNQ